MIIDTSTTHGKILVMQAHMEGNAVQCRCVDGSSGWHNQVTPAWDWRVYEYRITPQPREWFANIYLKGLGDVLHETRESADKDAFSQRLECIRVREILED